MVFEYMDNETFNSHFYFIPGVGGTNRKDNALLMLQEMFTNHGAHVIKGYPPRVNRVVRVMGRSLGYRKTDSKPSLDGFGRLCDEYEVRAKWVLPQH